MWTATLIEKTQTQAIVKFENGVQTLTEGFRLSSDTKNQVANRVAQLNAIDAAPLVEGVIDTTPATVTPPTQAELDLRDWLSKYQKWVKVKKDLIDTGILTGNEAQVINLKTAVQTGFKAAYIDYI